MANSKLPRKITYKQRSEMAQDETARLRTALNNLIGAVLNKKIEGLEDDLEEARAALEEKDE